MASFDGSTKLANLIDPKVFLNWIYRADSQTNHFIQSGVLQNNPTIASALLQPGRVAEIPAVNPLSGTPSEWNDSNDIVTGNVDSDTEANIKLYENKAFGATDWGKLVSGADALQQIASQFGHFWSNWETQLVLATVQSAFLNTDIATAKAFNVGTEKDLSATDFVKSLARMGDVASNTLSSVVVNSAAYSEMRQQNLIEYIQPSAGGNPIAAYQGMAIIQDDSIPVGTDGKTYALIFGPNAISFATATPEDGIVNARDEFKSGGVAAIIQKRVTALHVNGTTIDLGKTSADTYRADLLAGTKPLFKVAGDPRNIQIVKYGFKVAPEYVVPKINSKTVSSTKPSSLGK